MAERVEIIRTQPLHTLRVTWDAPPILTSGALTYPIVDFAALYRMSTGIYGRAGYRRMNQPFRYARPYIAEARFGSPLWGDVVVPTVIVSGAAKYGLPKLLDLVKQAMLLPSSIGAEREKNKRDQKHAELERMGIEEQLSHPDEVKRRAYAEQRAQIVEAEARELRSITEAAELLNKLDPAVLARVQEFYGENGLNRLVDIARRGEAGPARPRELEVHPTEDPERYPQPPEQLPPPG
jgi:hypothetical protein